MEIPRAKMPAGRQHQTALLHEDSRSSSSDDESDYVDGLRGLRYQRRRSLSRAGALVLLCLMTVVSAVIVLTYRNGNMFNGRMRLVSVSVVFNHGAQSSNERQTWEESDWNEGYGQLTVAGMNQMYNLGQQLRERYVKTLGFLPADASVLRDSVKTRSLNLDKTQDSALSVLLGLYDDSDVKIPLPSNEDCPCRPTQAQNKTWGPSSPACVASCMGLNIRLSNELPDIEVLPMADDWLLLQHEICEGWGPGSEETEDWRKTVDAFQTAFQDAVAFLGVDRLCRYETSNDTSSRRTCSGPPLGLRDLEQLFDNVLNAELAGKPCPMSVGLDCRLLLASLHPVKEFLWNYDFNRMTSVNAGGMLLGEILETMKRARKWHAPPRFQPRDEKTRPPAIYLYSAQDMNLAGLLGAMKAPWFHAPRSGSHVILELWAPRMGDMSNEELWMVNVINDGRPLTNLPGCSNGFCRFKDFFYSLFWTQAMYREDCVLKQAS